MAVTGDGFGGIAGGFGGRAAAGVGGTDGFGKWVAAGVGGAGGGSVRLRRRALGVVVALITVLSFLIGWSGAFAGDAQSPVPVRVHTVMSGETLWQIAAGVAEPGEDVRDVLVTIGDLNDLDGSHIEPGMLILLPRAV
ncbi:LysM peptidoglycan-binding domain-containing protein [Rarobacter incanus]|uniref:LysM domain-containing protein n=1 Tax=Rarobacter incanus TaxID=153494 RepID=A0A542SLN1_9MICO|nr:LysM peptidoglycan-binding domain-containing protein [Rarobacter incanus]TQK75478.1 LysM domain-containing protein [Rarobacter incanus]